MAKAHRSGITVHSGDVPMIIAMVDRGDRRHDIAAWFGLNQGRIAEVEDGQHGPATLKSGLDLPPSGSPGPKARALRASATKLRMLLAEGSEASITEAKNVLENAIVKFDKNE